MVRLAGHVARAGEWDVHLYSGRKILKGTIYIESLVAYEWIIFTWGFEHKVWILYYMYRAVCHNVWGVKYEVD
jgi:hypothetical protein